MNSPVLFQETQRYSPWDSVLLFVVAAILFGVLTMRQTTTVSPETITVRFGLLYTARIPVAEVTTAQAIAYRPVRDYGGWGIRGSRRRRALNTRGDRGVLLTKTDGSTLLIGSQKPRELIAALGQAGVRTEDRLPAETRDF
jgi:hypothetical protein